MYPARILLQLCLYSQFTRHCCVNVWKLISLLLLINSRFLDCSAGY